MARTLTDLANEMDALAAKIGGASSSVAVDTAMTILSDLVQVTPVDTGAALSNWQVTLDSPATDVIPAYSPAKRGKMVKGVWVHAADPIATSHANIAPTLAAARTILFTKRPGQVIYITNNLPYIQRLNDGSSEQAPGGYVDRAIILGGQVVARIKI